MKAFTVVTSVLIVAVAVFSAVLLYSGIGEVRLNLTRTQLQLTAEELTFKDAWVLAWGCVRHDLSVVVRDQAVYRLGDPALTPTPEGETNFDRIYTPLSSHRDCDDDHPRNISMLLSRRPTIRWGLR